MSKTNNSGKQSIDATPGGNKKKLLVIAALVLGVGGAGAAGYFLSSGHAPKEKVEEARAPIFVNLEPLTLNLRHEEEGSDDKFLQLVITVQVGEKEHEEMLKTYMPHVRSRLLLLLSSKTASEIQTPDGKKQLTTEILEKLRQPYSDKGPEQRVMNVLFTSFVVQ